MYLGSSTEYKFQSEMSVLHSQIFRYYPLPLPCWERLTRLAYLNWQVDLHWIGGFGLVSGRSPNGIFL